MSSSKASLVERAAEIYDFNAAFRVARAPSDLPPPRPRPTIVQTEQSPPAPRPALAPEPMAAPVRPQEQEQAAPAAPAVRAPRPVVHQVPAVQIDREALTRAGLPLPDAAPTALAEEMRLIKRRLLARIDADAARGHKRARVVLIASGQPGDGKTFVALNLALSIAGEAERSVLLVDGDTAKPDLPARLGFEANAGLVDALANGEIDPESLVVRTDLPGLSVLPAGRRERNVPELLASARTDAVLDRLLEADPRRIILIDSPPALAASTAAVMAEHVGQALMVVRADATAEADLRDAIELLSAAPHIALVLNNAALTIGGRRFGRYEEYR